MQFNKHHSMFRDIFEQPYYFSNRVKLYNTTKGNLDYIQRLGLHKSLQVHNGCVNCICWSDNGQLLLSGSDDQHLVVSHAFTHKTIVDHRTSHRANIFSAKFLPCSNNKNIISCSGDGIILFTDLMRPADTHNSQFTCHVGTIYKVATVPNEPSTFFSCGEDATVRFFDLRLKENCFKSDCQDDVLIHCGRAATALTINNLSSYQLAVGCTDSTVRLYDRRMLIPNMFGSDFPGYSKASRIRPVMKLVAPNLQGQSYRITSLAFSPDGEDILVSYSSEQLYLFSTLNENRFTMFNQDGTPAEDCEMDEADEPKQAPGLLPIRKLRLRGDWSDTGPDARPEGELSEGGDSSQARPTVQATLMQRITDVLARMLNDPATRASLSQVDSGVDEVPPQPDGDVSGDQHANDYNDLHSFSPNREYQEHEMETEPLQQQENDGNFFRDDVPDQDEEENLPNEMVFVDYRHDTSDNFSSDNQTSQSQESSWVLSDPTSMVCSNQSEVQGTSGLNQQSSSSSKVILDKPRTVAEQEALKELTSNDNVQTQSTDASSEHLSTERNQTIPSVSINLTTAATPDESAITIPTSANFTKSSTTDLSNISTNAGPSVTTSTTGFIRHIGRIPAYDIESNLNADNILSYADGLISNTLQNISDQMPEERIKEAINQKSSSSLSSDNFDSNNKMKVKWRTQLKQKYSGHRNARTMIKEANFWGNDHVISGSDCGHVFFWDRKTAQTVMLLRADSHVVNCVQPHPQCLILATSGIEYDVKLWSPVNENSVFSEEEAKELIKRNAVMLEQTKDTITVPASFMIRMIAVLNQIRRRRRRQGRDAEQDDEMAMQ